MNEQGNISINTENILPIIKKWLYSDKDIFIRELVSNSADAISKYRRLVEMGETEGSDEKFEIRIKVDK
ncbi:MAG: molecular chaperone HtpG, partial [Clostridia bacterium]|nr:molecular chaperone HtpG [Clostridia bacterium]